ncbi:hypothetical protein VPH35_005408 [Triticum aestivum]
MRVVPGGGEATVLVNQVDGFRLRFTNEVGVDQGTGQVYFTDSSMNFARSQHGLVTKTGDSTGRLMMYDPQTLDVTVLQARMTSPNGLLRRRTRGVNVGTSEPFADLPGYPDNMRPDKGGYWLRPCWVGLHCEKNELPFSRDSHLLVSRVGADEKIIKEMRGPKKVRLTKIMKRDNGKLYMGSVELRHVGVVKRK